jgi:hypothetical protein
VDISRIPLHTFADQGQLHVGLGIRAPPERVPVESGHILKTSARASPQVRSSQREPAPGLEPGTFRLQAGRRGYRGASAPAVEGTP